MRNIWNAFSVSSYEPHILPLVYLASYNIISCHATYPYFLCETEKLLCVLLICELCSFAHS